MNTPPNNLPDERRPSSPPPDPSRPVLDGMPPAWQFVYDRLREGHAAAVLGTQNKPGDPEAAAILRASAAAGRAFRQVYQQASMEALGRQIEGISGEPGE